MKTDGSKVFIPLLFRFLYLAWVTRTDFLKKKCFIVCASSKFLSSIFGDHDLTSFFNSSQPMLAMIFLVDAHTNMLAFSNLIAIIIAVSFKPRVMLEVSSYSRLLYGSSVEG